MDPRTLFLPEQGQRALEEDICPYCDGSLEGMQFNQEDGRVGGLVECDHCGIRFAWINNPFECEVQEWKR